jgi:4-hydroxymandelate oxidase
VTAVEPGLDLGRVVSLLDFEGLARERMDPAGFDYVAGGAWDEGTLREAPEAWGRYRFVPRVLRGVREIDLRTTYLGHASSLPIAIAPMAAQTLGHPGGEAEMARGAAAAGIPMCLSTSASMTIEEVAAAAPDVVRFFQLYLVGDLGYSRELVQRADAAGFRGILLTVDLPVLGYRDRDRRSGFALPRMPMVDGATAAEDRDRYGGLDRQREIGLDWSTVEQIRSWTSLPVVLKGILSPEDARLAVEAGVAGIVVSTHGARQLDRVIPTAEALGPIVDAVDGRCQVWVDGGLRRGLDVAIALALGADAVLIGRPFYWALAAGGAAGVQRAAAIVREELEIALTLLGASSGGELDRSLLADARA